jgi:hypothetical protein
VEEVSGEVSRGGTGGQTIRDQAVAEGLEEIRQVQCALPEIGILDAFSTAWIGLEPYPQRDHRRSRDTAYRWVVRRQAEAGGDCIAAIPDARISKPGENPQ